MPKRSLNLVLLVAMLLVLITGCQPAPSPTPTAPPPTAVPPAPTVAPQPTQPQPTQAQPAVDKSKWKFYYIMHMRSHPVLQLVEFGFLSRCEELGLKCEMAGPQDRDVEQTVAIGEQILAKGDATVVGLWATAQAYYPSVTKISEAGVPVVIPHFAIPEGTFGANVYKVLADPVQLADGAAKAMCEGLGDKAGTVARTQGSFNETENLQQATFAAAMAKLCPKVKVLPPEEEGFDAPKAIAKAVSLIQANPDIIGAFTSTGGGPGTWANAQVESGKQLVVVGPDYTRANLDWIKQGKVYALMAQPLYEEGAAMVDLMVQLAKGEGGSLPYWTVLPGPIVTPKDVDKYIHMLDLLEARRGREAEALKAMKFYYVMHMRSHPVLQLVEAGYRTRCKELGLNCEMIGPQDRDVEQTVAMAEQVLAKGDASAVGFWATAQAYYPSVTKISEAGVPVVIPHFAIPEGTFGANVYKVLANPVQLAEGAAKAMCEGLGDRAGTVARTQGSFNETENLQQETFAAAMAKLCPKAKILPPEEEGFDAPKAIAKAVSLIQANPDIIGAFTSTGGGPGTWANAQVESGKQLVVVGPDYTRANLDWIKQGKVYALMAQPLYEEGGKMVDLMVRAAKGEVLPYWTVLPGPIVTPKEVDKYYKMLDDVEKLMASGQ